MGGPFDGPFDDGFAVNSRPFNGFFPALRFAPIGAHRGANP